MIHWNNINHTSVKYHIETKHTNIYTCQPRLQHIHSSLNYIFYIVFDSYQPHGFHTRKLETESKQKP